MGAPGAPSLLQLSEALLLTRSFREGSEYAAMESVVLRTLPLTGKVQAAKQAAGQAEWAVRSGALPATVHLTDLSYYPGTFPLLYDLSLARSSEMFLSSNALASDPSPLLDRAVGGRDCPCRAEWEAFCNKTAAARAGSPCISCARACDTLLAMRISATLDSYLHTVIPSNPFTLGWLWTRGNGPNSTDFVRVWSVMPYSLATGNYSWAPLNTTVVKPSSRGGYPMTGLTEGREPFDRTPRWSSPYFLKAKNAVTITVGVPAWSADGEYLGGVSVDLPMSASRAFFLNLSFSSPIPFESVLSLSSGELVAASDEAVSELWGECADNLCDVTTLDPRIKSIAESAHNKAGEYWDITARGRDYIVFVQTLSNGWKLWFFVLRSDAFPSKSREAGVIAAAVVVPVVVISVVFTLMLVVHSKRMQRRVRDLEEQLSSMASESVIGTPAEDAIRALIRVQQFPKLPKGLKNDVSYVMTLIASNKLFKADSNLRQKLHDLNLDKDVDEFLLSVLAEKDQLHHLSRRDLSVISPGTKADILNGIETSEVCDSDELDNALAMVSSVVADSGRSSSFESWSYDVAMINVPTGLSLLEIVTMAALEANGLLTSFNIERRTVQSFIRTVERGYKGNPYHNSTHAADVVQAMHSLICSCSTVQFTPIERLGAIIASACHDYGHWGVNNAFLQATMDPIYLQYNGVSVLENMHCAESMKLLMSPDLNFTRGRLKREDVWELHRVVSQLVLATDMSRHLEITSQFSTRVTTGKVDGANKADRLVVLQMMIKAADVSNPTRPWAACTRWAQCVMSEFFGQGDREREEGLTVSPFMDRQTADTAKCQLAFIKFIVRPMSELVHHISPDVSRAMLANLEANSVKWGGSSLSSSNRSRK
eukprot:m51a1_g4831 putative camp-specific 3 -cyclic phosphodiesterase 4d-like isoform x6 (881) ;mRNA; f:188806-191801